MTTDRLSRAAGTALIELMARLNLGTERERLAVVIAAFDLSGVHLCRLADIGRAGTPVRDAHAALRAWLEVPEEKEVPA